MNIHYIGTADWRKIRQEDWQSVGVKFDKEVLWDQSNGYTIEVPKEVGKYLLESDPANFEEVKDLPDMTPATAEELEEAALEEE
jgi:hypothetical protein